MKIRLKEIMRECGITGRELASALNTSPQYISNVVSGRQNMSLDAIENVAHLLGVPIWQLFASREEVLSESKNEVVGECPHCGKPLRIKVSIE